MLTSAPTKYGAGITLYGDFYDLETLHQTIHKIADEKFIEERFKDYMLALAYDVRKAFNDARERRKLKFDDREKVNYKGVKILWPHFLIQVGMLRRYAGFRTTDHRDQGLLYLLEDCAITSLLAFDSKTGKECVEWLMNFPPFPHDYLLHFIEACTGDFISTAPKSRFQTLPDVLRKITWHSPEYRKFEKAVQELATEKGCSPHEFQDSTEWPDFKW